MSDRYFTQPKDNELRRQRYVENFKRRTTTAARVLVLCHGEPIVYTIEGTQGHWLGKVLDRAVKDMGRTYALYDNVDYRKHGVNAFSNEFVQDHVRDYDIVAVPDCGLSTLDEVDLNQSRAAGDWWGSQRISHLDQFLGLLMQTEQMIRRGGSMIVSKLVTDEAYQLARAHMKRHFRHVNEINLRERGFTDHFGAPVGTKVLYAQDRL